MPPGQDYYLLISNVPHGPYTAEQIQDWIKSQSRQADLNSVSFAIAGSSNWQPVSLFSEVTESSVNPALDVRYGIGMLLRQKLRNKYVIFSLVFVISSLAVFFAKQKAGDSKLAPIGRQLENNKIKIKGIYLGMDIAEARDLLKEKFEKIQSLKPFELYILKTDVVGWDSVPPLFKGNEPIQFISVSNGKSLPHGFIGANREGKIFCIDFHFDLIHALYETGSMSNKEFIQTFMGFNNIPEMDRQTVSSRIHDYDYTSPLGEHISIRSVGIDEGCGLVLTQQQSIQEKVLNFQ